VGGDPLTVMTNPAGNVTVPEKPDAKCELLHSLLVRCVVY